MDRVTSSTFLKAFPSARGLEPRDLRELLGRMRTYRAVEGERLFAAGDGPGPGFLILEGQVRVERQVEPERTVLLGRLHRGDVVGDMSLVDGRARSASAVVEQELLALCLEVDLFTALRAEAHPAALWLMAEIDRNVAARIRAMYDRITRVREDPTLAAEPAEDEPLDMRWHARLRRWAQEATRRG
ncbi:MAG: cyclic nucleotide-binding domain-containing protein [Alphaproteobacteria bacterium]|nr:cyclic nucleotide-binding domain-containing protein [Alphaproteobacteria bacterium]